MIVRTTIIIKIQNQNPTKHHKTRRGHYGTVPLRLLTLRTPHGRGARPCLVLAPKGSRPLRLVPETLWGSKIIDKQDNNQPTNRGVLKSLYTRSCLFFLFLFCFLASHSSLPCTSTSSFPGSQGFTPSPLGLSLGYQYIYSSRYIFIYRALEIYILLLFFCNNQTTAGRRFYRAFGAAALSQLADV